MDRGSERTPGEEGAPRSCREMRCEREDSRTGGARRGVSIENPNCKVSEHLILTLATDVLNSRIQKYHGSSILVFHSSSFVPVFPKD